MARLADRIAGKFIRQVLILTPLVWGGWVLAGAGNAFDIALSVLVVTCPCALSLATPTALTSATMRLRKLGFLPTKGHTLESLYSIDTVVFDKTGTLTRGELTLTGSQTFGDMDQASCQKLAAGLEKHSEHPIARVFHECASVAVENVNNHLGGGLSGTFNGKPVFIGHKAFVEQHTSAPPPMQKLLLAWKSGSLPPINGLPASNWMIKSAKMPGKPSRHSIKPEYGPCSSVVIDRPCPAGC